MKIRKSVYLITLAFSLLGCSNLSSSKEQLIDDNRFMMKSIQENSPFYNDFTVSEKLPESDLKENETLLDQYTVLQNTLIQFQNMGHIQLASPDIIKMDGKDYGKYFPNARNKATKKSYQEAFDDHAQKRPADQKERSPIDQLKIDTNVGINYFDDIAYLNIQSFDAGFLKPNTKKILDFYATLHDYPYLIIDVRNNGGGDSRFVTDLLVPYLIPQKAAYTNTAYFSGKYSYDYIQRLMKAEPFKSTHQVKKASSKEISAIKSYFNNHEIYRITETHTAYPNKDSVRYNGKIYVLMDRKCGSSTNIFLQYMRAAGATLIGQSTVVSGDIMLLNSMEIALPNSGFVVRMQVARAFHDGKPAEIVPDVSVENRTDILKRCEQIINGD